MVYFPNWSAQKMLSYVRSLGSHMGNATKHWTYLWFLHIIYIIYTTCFCNIGIFGHALPHTITYDQTSTLAIWLVCASVLWPMLVLALPGNASDQKALTGRNFCLKLGVHSLDGIWQSDNVRYLASPIVLSGHGQNSFTMFHMFSKCLDFMAIYGQCIAMENGLLPRRFAKMGEEWSRCAT